MPLLDRRDPAAAHSWSTIGGGPSSPARVAMSRTGRVGPGTYASAVTCQTCGAEIPEGAHFCPGCGTPVGSELATEERKVVTVLFADLVDSTGMAQRLDPERAREVLGAFFDASAAELTAMRGQPEKYIGDAVMAVFGLPTVHEDDALRAVRAGLAIRDRTRRLGRELRLPFPLEVRVGIESGDVATGVGPVEQLLVTGPVVNAAARLQAAAEPGEVLLGETAHALTNRSLTVGPPRAVEARGFGGTLAAYPVERLTVRSTRRTIPLVGRTAELALLRDSLARVAVSGRPHLFTVLGEPGMGKSRLADEFAAVAVGEPAVLSARVQPFGGRGTFAPVADMLRALAGIDEDDPPEQVRTLLAEIVAGCCHPSETDRVVARLALALGFGEEGRDESSFVQEAQSGFLSLVDGLSALRPVVLVLDDLHLAAQPMLDLAERLAGRARGRVLVVAAARPELRALRPAWGASAVNHTTIRLEPLGLADAVALVREAGGEAVDERTALRVAERAGGNPFFIVETTGMLARRRGPWLGREAGVPAQRAAPLPPTVQQVLAARLDHLSPKLRGLVRRASVFLYSFDLAELALVTEPDQGGLAALEDEEILVSERRPHPRWWFSNEALRDVAYAGLPKRERRRLHAQVADGLIAGGDLDSAAEHLEHAALASIDLDPADRTLPDRAVGALQQAGDRALRRMEIRVAADYFERALAMAGARERWGAREARILAGLGEARYWRSDYTAAEEALARAEELGTSVGDPWTLANALRFRGDIELNVGGDIAAAQALLDRSLAAAEELGDPRVIARTLLFAGWIPWEREDLASAEATWRRALELADANNDRWAQARALTALSTVRWDLGEHDEGRRLIEQALRVATDLGDQFSVAAATVQLARMHRDGGDLDEAIAQLDRAAGIFDDLGARWELADALGERGDGERRRGRLDEAEADLQASLRISEELGERQLAGWTWRQLAKVAERRGNAAEARERMRRADEEDLRRPQ